MNAVVRSMARPMSCTTLSARKRRTSSRKARSSGLSKRSKAFLLRHQQAGGRDLRIGDNGAVAAQMLARRTEQEFVRDQAFGVTAERQFIGTDGAVELDRVLMDEAAQRPILALAPEIARARRAAGRRG